MSSLEPVVVGILSGAEPLAGKIAALVAGRVAIRGHDFEDTGAFLRGIFAAGHPVIGICASGILIRSLAPMLGDKWTEPPVIAVAEDGFSVIPLLGGHHGANTLTARIAAALGGHAAVSTAGETRLGVALDNPPKGWCLENPGDAKSAMAALVNGAKGRLSGGGDWLDRLSLERVPSAISDPMVLSVEGCEPLVYRKQVFALGVGCARGCDPSELIGLVNKTLSEAGVSRFEIAGVYSVDLKSDEAAVHALAQDLDVLARFFDASTLEAETPRLENPSDVVFAEVGCHGVAEGAALAAAGDDGSLEIAKHKSANATCALARIGSSGQTGVPRGRVSVVGIGPGKADWRTPEASRLIAEADELVGYGLYIDLLEGLAKGKPRQDFPLGGEEDRCRYALERAGEGRNVALICSGDAGIYAMGALVMELLDRPAEQGGVSAAAKRVEVVNAPGVSALQAASARIGALLGHDFCTISLSDLLTPREDIVRRLQAAAAGDFVIAFYNPVSKKRRTLLAEAREILRAHRPDETPVLLASNLGRADETLTRRTLATLEVDEVDMLTVVLVGSSQSRAFETGDRGAGADGWQVYTPRGYAKRIDAKESA